MVWVELGLGIFFTNPAEKGTSFWYLVWILPDTACTATLRSHLCIPFLGSARHQSQFPYSCVWGRFIFTEDRSTYSLQQNRQMQIDLGNIQHMYKSLTDTWTWESGLWPRNSFSGNICFQFSVLVLCSYSWLITFFAQVVRRPDDCLKNVYTREG